MIHPLNSYIYTDPFQPGRALVNNQLGEGIKRNNPGNIRRSSSFSWQGEINNKPFTPGFAEFSTLAYGYRAMIKLLSNYIKEGNNTIYKIIYKWAPPSENDTNNYVSFVSSQTGIAPSTVIQVTDYATLSNIALAMSRMEHGNGMVNSVPALASISQAVYMLNNGTPAPTAPQYNTASTGIGLGLLSLLVIGGAIVKARKKPRY